MKELIYTCVYAKHAILTSLCKRVTLTLLVLCLAVCHAWAESDKLKEFESSAYDIRTDLIHNHTFDIANVRVADSLYAISNKIGSLNGKLYALQIKYYALAGNEKLSEFNKAVDEFIEIAQANEYYDEYFDAVSAKTQFLMGHHEYAKCMLQAKDMLNMAQKVHNNGGLYESNMLIGQIYKHMNAWLIAEKYLLRSLDAVRKMSDQDSIPYCLLYRELAECNIGSRNYDKALDYAVKAKSWAPFDTYRYFCEWTYLGVLYSAGKHDKFRREYAKSVLRDKNVTANLDGNMIKNLDIMVYVANGNFAEALKKAEEIDAMDGQFGFLSDVYYFKGDYKQAYDYLMKQQTFSDSIEMNLLQNELTEMEARLGNATLKYEAEQASAHTRLVMVISMALIFTIIIVFMTYNLSRRRKRHMQLLAAKEAVEQKNIQLTEAKEMTEKALVAAEKANAMRIHFIENMTHEIRTPLNAISGFVQVLTSPDIDSSSEEAREMKDIIMQSTDSLAQMLDNVIEISSHDSSSATVNIAATTVQEIIDMGLQNIPKYNRPEGVKINVVASDACSAMLETDASLASKALCHVLSNALKFTREGTVTIEAQTQGSSVLITITDTGIGLPEGVGERIFERFYKVDEFVPGTGLGLSLCRAIMNTLGGSVRLDNSYHDGGCRFVISLPMS